jgi:hypothetical protein
MLSSIRCVLGLLLLLVVGTARASRHKGKLARAFSRMPTALRSSETSPPKLPVRRGETPGGEHARPTGTRWPALRVAGAGQPDLFYIKPGESHQERPCDGGNGSYILDRMWDLRSAMARHDRS